MPLAWFLLAAASLPGRGSSSCSALAPFILPPVITALGFLTLLGARSASTASLGRRSISHAIFFVTLPLVTLSLGFASIDRALVEAAATMGADDRTVLRTVVLPLILPYLVSGYAFAFVLSLNEYIVAYMTVGFTIETLPIKIFNALRYGYTPTMAAVTIFFVAIVGAGLRRHRPLRRHPPAARRAVLGAGAMRIAAFQMSATAGDPAANLARIIAAAERAAARWRRTSGRARAGLDRLWRRAGDDGPRRSRRGPAAKRLAGLAEATGIAIVAGFAERDGDAVFNSALFVAPGGARHVYRKSHLYGAYERELFAAAPPAAVTLDFRGVKLGMLICYDVEFPENVRRLALAGAEAVLVPTALPAGDYAAFIARQMVPVRAFENQVFVAYVNHCGADPLFAYAGLSGVASPDGRLLAAAEADKALLLFADLDPAAYAASAAANSYLTDLRASS